MWIKYPRVISFAFYSSYSNGPASADKMPVSSSTAKACYIAWHLTTSVLSVPSVKRASWGGKWLRLTVLPLKPLSFTSKYDFFCKFFVVCFGFGVLYVYFGGRKIQFVLFLWDWGRSHWMWSSLVQQELLSSELRDSPVLISSRIADRHFYTHFLCGCKGSRLRLSFFHSELWTIISLFYNHCFSHLFLSFDHGTIVYALCF